MNFATLARQVIARGCLSQRLLVWRHHSVPDKSLARVGHDPLAILNLDYLASYSAVRFFSRLL